MSLEDRQRAFGPLLYLRIHERMHPLLENPYVLPVIPKHMGHVSLVKFFAGELGEPLLFVFMLAGELRRQLHPFSGRKLLHSLSGYLVILHHLGAELLDLFAPCPFKRELAQCDFDLLAFRGFLNERLSTRLDVLPGMLPTGGRNEGDCRRRQEPNRHRMHHGIAFTTSVMSLESFRTISMFAREMARPNRTPPAQPRGQRETGCREHRSGLDRIEGNLRIETRLRHIGSASSPFL